MGMPDDEEIDIRIPLIMIIMIILLFLYLISQIKVVT